MTTSSKGNHDIKYLGATEKAGNQAQKQ